jgi:hypothetical protein
VAEAKGKRRKRGMETYGRTELGSPPSP